MIDYMVEEYRTGGYYCPVTEEIRRQAAGLVGDTKSRREDAEELFCWVRDRYCWDMTKVRGSRYLITSGPTFAMSFDKSNLLVSLLRSQNIPARFRLIKCTFYNEFKGRHDDSIHAPVEVEIDGEWVIADPAFGKHTRKFKSVSEFGQPTWGSVDTSRTVSELPRWFVLMYNHVVRHVHPTVRQLRRELRECQDVRS